MAPGLGRSGALLVAAAGLSSALLFWAVGDLVFAAAFAAGLIAAGALLLLRQRSFDTVVSADPPAVDLTLARTALERLDGPAALLDAGGTIRCANEAYREWFGTLAPPASLFTEAEVIEAAGREACSSGHAVLDRLAFAGKLLKAAVTRTGSDGSWLLWAFERDDLDLVLQAQRLLEGQGGVRLAQAGIMAALADGNGLVMAGNSAFLARAAEASQPSSNLALTALIAVDERGTFRFAAEGEDARPLRIVQVPLSDDPDAPALFIFLDEKAHAPAPGAAGDIESFLDVLPHSLALVDSDGRFVLLNSRFRQAAALSAEARPLYPSDLVVDEDKAAVADAVRRLARGRAVSVDMTVTLKANPDDAVAMTITGIRAMGEAAVILSLKDNREEDRLKRQVAQATKMQAVGQLAGGVAHDFNNILTAILGHCDLMLMRHAPGDSDYDDIQQIRSNSNRAASLTRQLLAFSRQQTLRPQILQLPDVISEVSNLLKRLIGETVTLHVKHDRNLGAVRADPGQLEQVIVNLAVNARDAMLSRYPNGGGSLTLHTYSLSPDDVRALGIEIMPPTAYTALRVTDTGTGIPREVLPKIFEPFFTTKEVGKGTGLGLSTVYGIVKQSGGFIFADSIEGEGTSFTLYLPVHRALAAEPPRPKVRETSAELWGTGTILVVEDEAMVRAVAERALIRHGYTVLTAENGEAALEILAGNARIDLMISDVVMPIMDGPTTARRAREAHPRLPVLFISGYAEEQLRKSIDLENVFFLAKPFTVQRLAEATREAIASAAAAD